VAKHILQIENGLQNQPLPFKTATLKVDQQPQGTAGDVKVVDNLGSMLPVQP